jgi:hypothetical protein
VNPLFLLQLLTQITSKITITRIGYFTNAHLNEVDEDHQKVVAL